MPKIDTPHTPSKPQHFPQFISAYTVNKVRTPLTFPAQGKTKQSFKDECDINNIMARYRRTGLLEFVQANQARYMDCTGYDYQAAQQTIAQANGLFQAMPAALRAQFDNDPAKFLTFCEDERNLPRLEEMGLLRPDYQSGTPPTGAAPAAPPDPVPANPPAKTGGEQPPKT